MSVRNFIFWLHLAAGVVAGVVIAIMSLTGVAIAFEKQTIAWMERGARRVEPGHPASARRSLDEIVGLVRQQHPEARPSSITVYSDPRSAWLLSSGRTNAFYVNPYSGEVRDQVAKGTRRFMQTMNEWHRWLGQEGTSRPRGKAISGACNLAFLFLGVTGLYLWWPRQWSRSAWRSIGVMNLRLRGKARDWNWHNAIGVWSAPVLIVLTATALPISYRWAGDLIYKLTGTEAPPAGPTGAAIEVPKPEAGKKPLPLDELLVEVGRQMPQWEQITFRLGGSGPRRESGAPTGDRVRASGQRAEGASPASDKTASEGEPKGDKAAKAGERVQAVSVTVKERRAWPLFSNTQLTLDPFTGDVLRKEGFSDYNAGRKVRSWTRFLHTGEALGLAGQAVAGLASLGGAVLVWTGIALACRRLF